MKCSFHIKNNQQGRSSLACSVENNQLNFELTSEMLERFSSHSSKDTWTLSALVQTSWVASGVTTWPTRIHPPSWSRARCPGGHWRGTGSLGWACVRWPATGRYCCCCSSTCSELCCRSDPRPALCSSSREDSCTDCSWRCSETNWRRTSCQCLTQLILNVWWTVLYVLHLEYFLLTWQLFSSLGRENILKTPNSEVRSFDWSSNSCQKSLFFWSMQLDLDACGSPEVCIWTLSKLFQDFKGQCS